MDIENEQKRELHIDHGVLWPCLVVASVVAFFGIVYPDSTARLMGVAMDWTLGTAGAWYLWFAMGVLVFLVGLASSKYGRIVIGEPDEKKEYNELTWAGLMFCAGIGLSVLYWALMEPINYVAGPPFGVDPYSDMAYEWAGIYGSYHWGLMPWALYTICTIPIAYSHHVRKTPQLRLSTACEVILGKWTYRWPGKLIEMFVLFGLIGGVGTSLGLSTPMVSGFFSRIFNIPLEPNQMTLNTIGILILTAIFTISVFRGLNKGIKVLSNANVYLCFFFLALVLVFGPTSFMVNSFTNGFGLELSEFFRMGFNTDPISQTGWPQGWTIFFWAWWLAYSPFMGLWVARVSRGRTIRSIIFGQLGYGSLGCFLVFLVVGGFSLHTEFTAETPISQIAADLGNNLALVEIVYNMPLPALIVPVFLILQFIFGATTLDSAAYVMASACTKEILPSEQPARWNRLLWVGVLGGVSLVLMFLGGLKPLQTASIIVAFPITFIAILLNISLFKSIKQDFAGVFDQKAPVPVVKYESKVGGEK